MRGMGSHQLCDDARGNAMWKSLFRLLEIVTDDDRRTLRLAFLAVVGAVCCLLIKLV